MRLTESLPSKIFAVLVVLERGIVQEEDELENKNQLPAGLRIRKTQHATTLRLLIDAITEFNAEQVDYKEKCEERIQRVVSIGKRLFRVLSYRRHNNILTRSYPQAAYNIDF